MGEEFDELAVEANAITTLIDHSEVETPDLPPALLFCTQPLLLKPNGTYRDQLLEALWPGDLKDETNCPIRRALWRAEVPFNERDTTRWTGKHQTAIRKARDNRRKAEAAGKKSEDRLRKANDPETRAHHQEQVEKREAAVAEHDAVILRITAEARRAWKACARLRRHAKRAANLYRKALSAAEKEAPGSTNDTGLRKVLASRVWSDAESKVTRKRRGRELRGKYRRPTPLIALPGGPPTPTTTFIGPLLPTTRVITYPPVVAAGAFFLAGMPAGRNDVYSTSLAEALQRTARFAPIAEQIAHACDRGDWLLNELASAVAHVVSPSSANPDRNPTRGELAERWTQSSEARKLALAEIRSAVTADLALMAVESGVYSYHADEPGVSLLVRKTPNADAEADDRNVEWEPPTTTARKAYEVERDRLRGAMQKAAKTGKKQGAEAAAALAMATAPSISASPSLPLPADATDAEKYKSLRARFDRIAAPFKYARGVLSRFETVTAPLRKGLDKYRLAVGASKLSMQSADLEARATAILKAGVPVDMPVASAGAPVSPAVARFRPKHRGDQLLLRRRRGLPSPTVFKRMPSRPRIFPALLTEWSRINREMQGVRPLQLSAKVVP